MPPLRAPGEPQPREGSGAAGGGGGFGIPEGTDAIGRRSCWNLLVPAVRTPEPDRAQGWGSSPLPGKGSRARICSWMVPLHWDPER